MNQPRLESSTEMHSACVTAGSYYWYRAEGPHENMISALNRAKYRQMVERFDAMGIPRPSAEEMYAAAASKWPKHKLHTAPGA